MRRYETVFILRPSQSEDEINAIIEKTKNIIVSDKGRIIDINKWGMKKLAYTIKKEIQGQYVFCDFSGTPAVVVEIERKFRIDDAVLKYLTIKTASTVSEEEIDKAVADADAKHAAQINETAEDKDHTVIEEGIIEATTDEE